MFVDFNLKFLPFSAVSMILYVTFFFVSDGNVLLFQIFYCIGSQLFQDGVKEVFTRRWWAPRRSIAADHRGTSQKALSLKVKGNSYRY